MNATFRQALEEAQSAWMNLEGVEAVGEGEVDGRPCIRVFVSGRTDAVEDEIPDTFRGFPVRVHDSGIISAGGSAP